MGKIYFRSVGFGGPVTAAEVTAAVYSPAEDGTAEDGTAVLYKKVGRYGGSHDTHFTMDGAAVLETFPKAELGKLAHSTCF